MRDEHEGRVVRTVVGAEMGCPESAAASGRTGYARPTILKVRLDSVVRGRSGTADDFISHTVGWPS